MDKLEITEITQSRKFKEDIPWTGVVVTEMDSVARTENCFDLA